MEESAPIFFAFFVAGLTLVPMMLWAAWKFRRARRLMIMSATATVSAAVVNTVQVHHYGGMVSFLLGAAMNCALFAIPALLTACIVCLLWRAPRGTR